MYADRQAEIIREEIQEVVSLLDSTPEYDIEGMDLLLDELSALRRKASRMSAMVGYSII